MADSSGTWSLGTRLKCHIAAIGEKNRQVCPHPVGGENRVRFSLAIKFAAIGESNRQVCRRLNSKASILPSKLHDFRGNVFHTFLATVVFVSFTDPDELYKASSHFFISKRINQWIYCAVCVVQPFNEHH